MTEIGRVIGTEKKPNTAYTFHFWTEPAAKVGIGTLVKVVTETEQVYGTVVEAHGFNDLESPLHEFFSIGGDPGRDLPTHRPEMRLFEAAVLRREPEEPIGAVPIGAVYLADEKDVRMALRTDGYVDNYGIPCGCYGTKSEPIAVHLDGRFLLGPEAGHLNMTGTSGLAAKTSYILFLIKSIFQHHRDDSEESGDKGVAVMLFNTKGGDLLYIDRDPATDLNRPALDELDEALFEACGVTPGPFEKVDYYAPLAKDAFNVNSIRRNAELEATNPTRPFTFGLADIIKHVEVLLNKDDLDAKADAYLQYLNERFIEGEGHTIGGLGEKLKARSLDDLVEIVQKQLRHVEGQPNGGNQYESHSSFTMRKMYNRISNIGKRFSGLVAERNDPVGPFDEPFKRDTVYVIDVSRLGLEEQDLVFAAFITKLRERMEEGKLGVGRMIVMVDELNKYAPSGGPDTYVSKALREIAARGRYMGLVLFGGQQFRSRVDKEVVGNAATHCFGHVESEELAQPGYSHFSPAVKEKLGALSPGEVLLKHPHFAQPIFVRFPKPVIVKGGEGMKRFPPEETRPVRDIMVDEIKRTGANHNEAIALLDELSPSEPNLVSVLADLRRARSPEDALRALKGGKRPVKIATEPRAAVPDFDPFATN